MTSEMSNGRHAGTERRRSRVREAITTAARHGAPLTASAIARAARVDRTFLYRHRDLLALIHAAELEPAQHETAGASQPCLTPSRPGQRTGPQHPARRPHPAVGEAPVRGTGGTDLAGVRPRRPRRMWRNSSGRSRSWNSKPSI